MYEGVRSPAVHMPKTLSDLYFASNRFPKAIFWAGSTHIMSRPNYYPDKESPDVISLQGIPELHRISRTEKYLEIGSMVTFAMLLRVGRQVLSPLLQKTLENTATKIIRRQITFGGSLATVGVRYALAGTLAALQGEVEVKSNLGPRTETQWLEVERLYDKQGRLLLKGNELITRIRLSFERETFSTYRKGGSAMQRPEECVFLSLNCTYSQSVINHFKMAITFPTSLFLIPYEVGMMMSGTMLPLTSQHIERAVKSISDEIVANATEPPHPIQLERAKRFIEASLHELNAQSLSSR